MKLENFLRMNIYRSTMNVGTFNFNSFKIIPMKTIFYLTHFKNFKSIYKNNTLNFL